MEIIDLVKEDLCQVNLKVNNKEELLSKIAFLFTKKFEDLTAQKIFEVLMEREKLGSTGFGGGIAIPHAKLKDLPSFAICIVTLKKAIDYDSLDKKKVKIAIALLGPMDKQKKYLKLLAQVSKIIRKKSVLSEMKQTHSPSVLKEAFIKGIIPIDEDNDVKKVNKMLLINLKEKRYLDDIINLLIEEEISNAVVTDSNTIETYLTTSPLFCGFLSFLEDRSGSCMTIMAAINENDMAHLIDGIENIMGDLDTHSGIQIIGFDISFIKGAI
jgi:PTS system nitrogen regulatory IIA component